MSSVDVIVPCYRYGRYLRQCVESVLSQDIESVRVLIIDDASPDETAAVAQALVDSDERVTFIRHATNQKHIATYNEGIEWASATYLLLLSADDYLYPGALRRAVEFMDSVPAMGLSFGNADAVFDNGSKRKIAVPIAASGSDRVVLAGEDFIHLCASSGSTNIVPTPTAVVRTEYLKRLGGYLPELPHCGDLEMWLRIAAFGPIGFVPDLQAAYRRHTGNMSLDYQVDDGLADLQQRKAAVDMFIERCHARLASPRETHRRLLRPLAREAIAHAGSALVAGRRTGSNELAQFALSIDALVRWTPAWFLLSLKRVLGATFLTAIRPIFVRSRRAQ